MITIIDLGTELGKLGICPEYCCAAADAVEVTIRGIGGHGARPEQTKDPTVMAAQFILAIQTIASRSCADRKPSAAR